MPCLMLGSDNAREPINENGAENDTRLCEEDAEDEIMVFRGVGSSTFDVMKDANRLLPQPQAESNVRSVFPVGTIC